MASALTYLDVLYQGTSQSIACGVLETSAGLLLVDPGPTVSMKTLVAGLQAHGVALQDVHALLLTHIHLDHAGATGSLVQAHPDLQVYVHERGAPHLINPARLLDSARRIYGDAMDTLWGDFLAVPAANVHVLKGGEAPVFGGRRLQVAYTPGHAVHHVSYLDEQTGTAFVGDVAGMCLTGLDYVLPVTPPPDVDLEAWHESLALVRSWAPEQLFLTHFGPATDPDRHLDDMGRALDLWSERVRISLEDDADDATRAARFHEAALADLKGQVPPAAEAVYVNFGHPMGGWYGLARYWRKRG